MSVLVKNNAITYCPTKTSGGVATWERRRMAIGESDANEIY